MAVTVVNQYYEAQVYDVFVIKGNAAVFKCNIPSFVADHVEISNWEDSQGGRYLPQPTDYGKHGSAPLGSRSDRFPCRAGAASHAARSRTQRRSTPGP